MASTQTEITIDKGVWTELTGIAVSTNYIITNNSNFEVDFDISDTQPTVDFRTSHIKPSGWVNDSLNLNVPSGLKFWMRCRAGDARINYLVNA